MTDTRAADGRVPGRRGQATRQRLLDCTREMLRSESYRNISVVDIAREAGTSPATFYQYFGDVETAVLALAEEMVTAGSSDFAARVTGATWSDDDAHKAAIDLSDRVLEFWDEHRAVLRVVDLATEEGDGRFANVRTRLLNELYRGLSAAVAEQQRAGRVEASVSPDAVAGVLVAMLVHVSAHRLGFAFWGVPPDQLRDAMARIITWSVSGQEPPSAAPVRR